MGKAFIDSKAYASNYQPSDFNGSSFCCAALAAVPVVVRGVRGNLVY